MVKEDFLEYCGLKKDKSGKEMFSGSFSGIDGGDIDAEYWFMGMEWSDIDDINNDYSYVYDKWINVEEIPDHVDIKTNPSKWKLENKLDILYHKLMPEFAGGKTIFEKDSNALKLNLLPLAFLNDDAKEAWDKTRLEETTGFEFFNEYKSGVLPARQKLFQNLLQKGKKPKTIFCFGKDYENEFILALTGKDKRVFEYKEVKLYTKSGNGKLGAIVYNVDSSEIKRIIISPFPYSPYYTLTPDDWDIIKKLAQEDWKKVCELATE